MLVDAYLLLYALYAVDEETHPHRGPSPARSDSPGGRSSRSPHAATADAELPA
jgi:hypothetical protein